MDPPSVTASEYVRRREAVCAGLEAAGLAALAVFYPARVVYLTGFHHIPTERPVVLVLGSSGRTVLVVPAVEKEHAESIAGVDRVETYFEYPGERHPMHTVVDVIESLAGGFDLVSADHDGVVPYWGYRGPRLSQLTGVDPAPGELLIETLRQVKSAAELECIQVSCDWAGRAHRRLQAEIAPGRTEMECYRPAETESLRELIAEMPGWRPRGYDGAGLTAMFVAGRSTAMPHGFVQGHGIQPGDVLVSGASVDMDGYHSELERTMIVGPPSREQERAFEQMLELQSRAVEAIGPGVPLAAVELEVVRAARELGCEGALRHHVGHSIGLEGHEAPFLDRGESGTCEPGMVFTVEPGLYFKELGGFRHSDTVCVTESGRRVLTHYPRELAELSIDI